MKTRGELEAAISDGVSRFEQDYFGRGPQHIHAQLIGDLLVIRLLAIIVFLVLCLILYLAWQFSR